MNFVCAAARPSHLEQLDGKLPDDELAVVVGEVSEFQFFAASNRKDDKSGALIDAESDGLAELDPVEKQVEAEDRSDRPHVVGHRRCHLVPSARDPDPPAPQSHHAVSWRAVLRSRLAFPC